MSFFRRVWGKIVRPNDPSEAEEHVEATHAIENAQVNLRRAQTQGVEVGRVSESLRELRYRNHFGEAIEAAMMRRRA